MKICVNGETVDISGYGAYHERRFGKTLELVRKLGGGDVIELGGHPWAMTSRLLRDPGIELLATVSAEEVTAWPDDFPVRMSEYTIKSEGQEPQHFTNYSANIERRLLTVGAPADIVLACEIIEHMTRAPHMLLLNANAWLRPGGRIIITTPNGSQLENPFRVRPKMPSFRYSTYSRHNYVFTLDGLKDLVSVCGFEIEHVEYWSPYKRSGGSNLYRALSRFNNNYVRAKFAQSLCVVGRKVAECSAAVRLPKVYAPSAEWEHIGTARPGA